jgi:chemotaxis protein MotB
MRTSSASKKIANQSRNRDSESWIYSYADLITNLLALFIMLLVLNSGKVKAGVQNQAPADQVSVTDSQRVQDLVQQINLSQPATTETSVDPAASRSVHPLQVLNDDDGLKVSFGGEMLFPSGSSELRDESLPVLARISALLQTLPKEIVIDVEGHSDSTPTRKGRYPSNWELSSARAGSVVRALEDFGFPPERMRAIGLADTKPTSTSADLAANRRVVLRVRMQGGG